MPHGHIRAVWPTRRVDHQIAEGRYGSVSEYIRELIAKNKD
jgi:Arc/MetJ-type ribon-helix-helix transcriptional regulator